MRPAFRHVAPVRAALRIAVSAVTTVAVLALAPAVSSPAAAAALTTQRTDSIRGTAVGAAPRPKDLSQGTAVRVLKPAAWPAAATATVDLAQGRGRAAGLPVELRVPAKADAKAAKVGKAQVSVVDRAKVPAPLRDAMVLRVGRADGVSTPGRATVSVDYTGFAGKYGAGWSSRLRLYALPDCSVTTPDAPGCAPVPLASVNDAKTGTVTADATVRSAAAGGTMLALAAGSSGSDGDYGATNLQASSSWSAGGSTGDFSWTYPLRSPPSLGGPKPSMSLAYSSSAVDGRSETSNNQPTWVGEGFDYWPGYVERRYKPCASDKGSGANNTTDSGDQCWGTDNAVISLNGRSNELIRDDAAGTWRLKNDDGSKVERLNNTVNGDNDNEYWKVTTPDGNQYFFGLNRLPGYTGTAPANKTTGSVWTAPVAGNHTGEPCHASGFVASFCNQAWRWNLDYVVDLHGNSMSLFYASETNKYGRNLSSSDVVSYVRGGTLDHIDYGTDRRSGTDTENTSTAAPMRIAFGTADRCLSSCATHDQAHWPDVPWDLECTGTSCANKYSPTFWSTKRLASVTAKVWDAAGAQYRDVESWTLTHNFPDPGDGTRAGLWLESVAHTGLAAGSAVSGGSVSMPDVNFDWIQLPNRVDTATDGKPAMNWMRMGTIWTDTGGKVDIRYTGPDCVAGSHMPASPQTNTMRCYPVLEEQPDKSIKTEYFHKYLVTSVTQADLVGGSPDVVTSYEYVGGAAWRHTDDDGLTKDNLRTWSDFRGYSQVNTRVGDPGSGIESLSESIFFRGMHDDLNGSGSKRSVTLPALDLNGDGDTTDTADASAVNDEDRFSGMVRLSTVYDGTEAQPVSATASQPWQGAVTASRNMGQTTATARATGMTATWSAIKVAAGGWRVTRQNTVMDGYGMVTQLEDLGDVAVTGDEKCTKTTYNRSTGLNLLSLAGQTEIYALTCDKNPQSEADVIQLTRASFDGQAYGSAPTKGETTRTERAKSWTSAGGPVWLIVATEAFDAYGRGVDATDARGNHTLTAYTPASGGPVTRITTTNPNTWSSYQDLEPAWGSVTAKVDVNSRRTDISYDALGRITQVWLPNHLKATYPAQPSSQFAYLVRNSGGPTAVTTQKLNAASAYVNTYALFDGLLRPRQSQSPSQAAGNVGTIFSETKYDALGRESVVSTHFDASVQPSTTLFTILDWQPKTLTLKQYDRADRAVVEIMKSAGAEISRTTTTYGGDRVSVVPPAGGTALTRLTDAAGHTVEQREYHDPADVGSGTRALYDLTTYHYNGKGQKDSVTDNANTTWSYQFDLLGRQTGMHDPDKGDSSAEFNDAGDLLSTTDSRGAKLAYSYDNLGRKTAEFVGSTSGTKLASWAYDPAGGKGQLASASRWTGTDEYKVKVRGYTPTYQSTGEDFVIPASQTGLAGTYTITRTYKVDGSPAAVTYPNVGSLGAETVTYTYDPVTGLAEQLQTNVPGFGQYVANTDYTAYGELSFTQYQLTGGSWVQRSFTYDDATRRLTRAQTVRQTAPQAVADVNYAFDAFGNITKIADQSTADTQCFAYDGAQRVTDAWTPSSGSCTDAKSAAALGGPAAYWQSWTFDAVGDRKTQTLHASAGDTTATYTYPATAAQPHAVGSVATTGPGVNRTDSYGYDSTGNTTSRPGQTLAWDEEGRLNRVSAAGTGTEIASYLYTADGARLIASDATTTTLYLPDHEVRRNKSTGTVTATRYYSWGGQAIASVSTGAPLTWLVSDNQGTQQIAIASGNQAVTQRRQDPYGNARGANPAWPNSKGFVGGEVDPTGLTHLGAREYDSTLGRFISVDPVFDFAVTQSWTGYGYAGNSPVTQSDPSGLCWLCDVGKETFARAWIAGVETIGHPVANAMNKIDNFGQKVAPVIDGVTEVLGGPADLAWDAVQQTNTAVMGTPSDPSAFRLGWEWATGNGPKDRTLTDDNRFTQTLQQHQHVQATRQLIADRINSGDLKAGQSDTNKYSLADPASEALNKLVSDFTSNSSAAFLGSYQLKYTVKAVDEQAGTATVEFEVTNNSTINSATHTSPVLGGYGPWWRKRIEPELNENFGETGPGSKKTQTIRWTETISLKNPKPPAPAPSPVDYISRMFRNRWIWFM
ncbi:type IV secretion protein Rhs [Catellatospora sp. TT07R-123]|uniref:RHS repeat domain-containing protein n=1 Tax=Catellatospora sp. TT07R-123 TaxID=2733863 RepID=UPI001B23AF31|nr:RHS repeat-associated core domain-containing protein [Catellatospora sp. TT07R-123]GHJ48549.1 type IV secretion protein Rhs [Catellatospora sp. TT07R-123]